MLPPIEIKLTEDPASVVAILARQISEVCGLEMPITEHEMQILLFKHVGKPSQETAIHRIKDTYI